MLAGVTLALLAAVAFLAGLVDAVAGGGGLLTLPAILLAGVPPHVALGTNKIQSVCGTTAAALRFAHGKKVDVQLLWWFVPVALAGSALGSRLVLLVSPSLLRPVMVPLFVAIGLYLALRGDVGREAQPALRTPGRRRAAGALVFLIGLYDGFLGPGTGVFLFMALVVVLGLDAVAATGTTKVLNWSTNAAAVAVFLWHGTYDGRTGLLMALANTLGGLVGSHLAVTRGQRLIRWMVLAVVVALALSLGYTSWRELAAR